MKDHYSVLEVRPNATQEDIKRAWREQLQVWHPDRFAHNPLLQKKAEERSKLINQAYEILSDLGERRSYDSKKQSSEGFTTEANASRTEEKTITNCPNPTCGTKLRVPMSGRLKVCCPLCGYSFIFDFERSTKENIRSKHGLPEFEIRTLLSLKGASPQVIAVFLELAQQVLHAYPDALEIRTTKQFVPFSLKTAEQSRNFADIISVAEGKIDLALKTGEPQYPFSDLQGKARPIRSQAKKFRFGSFQREVSLQRRDDIPYIKDLVLQCFNNLSRRQGL